MKEKKLAGADTTAAKNTFYFNYTMDDTQKISHSIPLLHRRKTPSGDSPLVLFYFFFFFSQKKKNEKRGQKKKKKLHCKTIHIFRSLQQTKNALLRISEKDGEKVGKNY